MGGGISGMSPDVFSNLSKENLQKLQKYQSECEEQKLTPFEMFTMLSKKYEELITEQVNSAPDEDFESLSDIIPKLKLSHEGLSESVKLDLQKNPKLPQHLADFYNERERLEKIMLEKEVKATLKEINQLELAPINDPYVEDMVGKIFCINTAYQNVSFDDYFALNDQNNLNDSHITHCAVCKIDFDTHSHYKQHVLHSDIHIKNSLSHIKRLFDKFKEGERLAKLAQSTVNMFYKHLDYSENDGIGNIGVENTVVGIAERHSEKYSGNRSHNSNNNGSHSNNSSRRNSNAQTSDNNSNSNSNSNDTEKSSYSSVWRRAMGKVIAARLKNHYESLVDTLLVIPKDVKLLYNNAKFHYNIKANFIFYFYLHLKHQCIEAIPYLFLPSVVVEHSSGTGSGPGEAVEEAKDAARVATIGTEEAVVALTTAQLAAQTIVPGSRIYLDYSILLNLVMGNNKSNSVIVESSQSADEQQRVHDQHSNNNTVSAKVNSNNTPRLRGNSVDEKNSSHNNVKHNGHSHNNNNNNNNNSNSNTTPRTEQNTNHHSNINNINSNCPTSTPISATNDPNLIKHINDSICVFIFNHLKTHNLTKKQKQLPPTQQHLQDTLYFDIQHLSRSPFMTVVPEGVTAVPLNIEKVYALWREKCEQNIVEKARRPSLDGIV